MIRLGSNIASLKAQRRLGESSSAQGRALERLSSGMRINRAADDAAGLSVAESLRAGGRIYTQAIRNINDGMSLLAIAEAALSELSSIVTRQKELAEQAANGVYSPSQRVALNRESAALTREYNRIVKSTSFNGQRILDGSEDAVRIQQGFGIEESTLLEIGQQLGIAAGNGTFNVQQQYATGSDPTSVAVSDFNGDGIVDLVTADRNSDTVSVHLGNGDGTFQPRQAFGTGIDPYSVAIGDFNGDGIPDLVTADLGGTASVLLGNGDGTFQARQSFGAGSNPTSVAIGDFNGDGIPDLVTADLGGTASVLLGNGDGTFQARQSFGAGSSPYSVAVADLNGDGIQDLATADQDSHTVSILLGNGDGSFQARQTFSTGDSPASVAVADFNDDGIPDLVTADFDGFSLSVLIGNGNGSFQAPQALGTAGNPTSVTVGDFNGDGIPDLVAAEIGSSTAGVFLGNGDGSFQTRRDFGIGAFPSSVAIGDFNGDGVEDVVTANGVSNTVSVLIGNADPTGRRNTLQAVFDITTIQGARDALTSLSRQLDRIGSELGKLGSFQSRLGSSLRVLLARVDNYETAASRIIDADVAEESAALVRTSILQQAGVAILAQANQEPALALKLLQPEPTRA